MKWSRRKPVDRAWLNDAAALLFNPPDVFVADSKGRDLALFYLFLAIQECIDLAAHWVASPPSGVSCWSSRKALVSDGGI